MSHTKRLRSQFRGMKFPKPAVDFEHPGRGKDYCGICRYYLPDDRKCRIVAGVVEKEDWCNQFARERKG